MEAIFLGAFGGVEDVAAQFQEDLKYLKKDIRIILAEYDQGDYDGSAFVLFTHKGKLYEVNGSHCSCYGLEGQWDPEEVTKAELTHRLEKGTRFAGYPAELREVLKRIRLRK